MPRFRLLAVPAAVVLLAGCGKPPDLRDGSNHTASPPPPLVTGAPPLGLPSAYAPSVAPYTPPATPPKPLTPVTPTIASPSPTAPRCGSEPTNPQVVAAAATISGMPDASALHVVEGPYCAMGWQFTVVAGTGEERLSVVTHGNPAALTVVEIGTDVCSPTVIADAPPGIRNLACRGGR